MADNRLCKPGGVFAGIGKELEEEKRLREEALAAEKKQREETDTAQNKRIDNLVANGAGGLWKGPWQVATVYGTDETVEKDGTLYRSDVRNNTSVPPSATWVTVLQYDYGYYVGEAI